MRFFRKAIPLLLMLLLFTNVQCSAERKPAAEKKGEKMQTVATDTATFGAGCFWCVEAVFQRVEGVVQVTSGYSGGTTVNPTYEQVCTGNTGHAEVCQITFDSAKVTFDELLEIYWKTHDPTTMNRQGADVGTQYRSVIFYHNQQQKERAEYYKAKIDAEKIYDNPLITLIVPFEKFYPAENYHQDYYNNNTRQGYCSFVITPKIEKFKKIFKDKLKEEYSR